MNAPLFLSAKSFMPIIDSLYYVFSGSTFLSKCASTNHSFGNTRADTWRFFFFIVYFYFVLCCWGASVRGHVPIRSIIYRNVYSFHTREYMHECLMVIKMWLAMLCILRSDCGWVPPITENHRKCRFLGSTWFGGEEQVVLSLSVCAIIGKGGDI